MIENLARWIESQKGPNQAQATKPFHWVDHIVKSIVNQWLGLNFHNLAYQRIRYFPLSCNFPMILPLSSEPQFGTQVKFDFLWNGFVAHCTFTNTECNLWHTWQRASSDFWKLQGLMALPWGIPTPHRCHNGSQEPQILLYHEDAHPPSSPPVRISLGVQSHHPFSPQQARCKAWCSNQASGCLPKRGR